MSESSGMDGIEAYVLHARPYRDTSLLIDFFSKSEGRFSGIARGGAARQQAYFRPFMSLWLTLAGKTDLKTVKQVEANPEAKHFSYRLMVGEPLVCGLYLNELLIRLLPPWDQQLELFNHYEQTLKALFLEHKPTQPILREFEWFFLEVLGYGLGLYELISQASTTCLGYAFDGDSGWQAIDWQADLDQGRYFSLNVLQAIAQKDYTNEAVLKAAKRLSRLALAPRLGNKPLQTRLLFQAKQNLVTI